MAGLDPIRRLYDLRGWRRLVAAFLAGSASVLAHAPFHLWPLLFVTLPVLVWVLDGLVAHCGQDRRLLFKKTAVIGWAFGFGYFLFGLYWIGKAFLVEAGIYIFLMPVAMTLMPAGLALFYALGIGLASLFWKPGLSRVLILAATLAMSEWLRGHVFTGFPWNALGHVFAGEAGLSQLSSLAGPNSLSFFCVLVFASPAIGLHKMRPERRAALSRLPPFTPFAVMTTALLLASLWGHARLGSAVDKNVEGVRLRLVQPNIKQVDKWRPGNAGPIYRTMLKLSGAYSEQYKRGLLDVTHLIWPESALPFFMARSREALEGIDKLLPDHVTLITGAMRTKNRTLALNESRRAVFNSLFVLNGKAQITATFDKKHLVPFGEYLPYHNQLSALGLHQLVQVRGHFQMGRKNRLINPPNAPSFAPLICYEVVFPEEVVEAGQRPKWLLNVTNDAWYGISTGPYQHFLQARIRAIEQGLPMIRVANTGISGVIGPYGRVKQSLSLARAGTLDAPLPASIAKPLYAHMQGRLFWLILAGASGLILLIETARKRLI